MGIEKITCFLIRCDGCGPLGADNGWPYLENPDTEEPEHYADEDSAIFDAVGKGWTTDGKYHHCGSCSKNRPLSDPNAEPDPEPIPVLRGQIPLGAKA